MPLTHSKVALALMKALCAGLSWTGISVELLCMLCLEHVRLSRGESTYEQRCKSAGELHHTDGLMLNRCALVQGF